MTHSERAKRPNVRRMPRRPPLEAATDWRSSGLCDEAQADGVPCSEPGRTCECCEHAHRERRPPPVVL